MSDLWRQFKGDFNSMTDAEIDQAEKEAQETIERETEWTEAISSWRDAGKPRDT